MSIISNIKYDITSKEWWKAASLRALRTAIAAAVPLLVAVNIFELDWLLAASTVGLSALVSYLTSLGGLKEVAGTTVNKVLALATRGVKTFAQVLVSYIGTAVVIQEVDWNSAIAVSISATVVSLLAGISTQLPEAEEDLTKSIG